jgi:hypothetical protein
MSLSYNYSNIKEIDYQTLDYLKFVVPKPIEDMDINEINEFLNKLEEHFIDLDGFYEDIEYE